MVLSFLILKRLELMRAKKYYIPTNSLSFFFIVWNAISALCLVPSKYFKSPYWMTSYILVSAYHQKRIIRFQLCKEKSKPRSGVEFLNCKAHWAYATLHVLYYHKPSLIPFHFVEWYFSFMFISILVFWTFVFFLTCVSPKAYN